MERERDYQKRMAALRKDQEQELLAQRMATYTLPVYVPVAVVAVRAFNITLSHSRRVRCHHDSAAQDHDHGAKDCVP